MDFDAILRTIGVLIIKFFKWFFKSFIWLFLLMFAIDIISKQLVKNFMTVGQEIVLIPNFLSIHYVQNNGMAFGIEFGNDLANTIFFICVSVIGFLIISGVMIYYRKKMTRFMCACGMLMLAGCLGNLIDRAFYVNNEFGFHYVVDFIGFFGPQGFPRFNVADSCLVIGTFMLIVYLFVIEIKNSLKNKKQVKQISTSTSDIKQDNDELNNNK